MLSEIQTREKLLQLLKDLPEQERLILALSYQEKLSFEDIAFVLNRPVKEITKSFSEILEKLKEGLKQ